MWKWLRLVVLLPVLGIPWNSRAQISGTVYDAELHAPLSGAVISTDKEQIISGTDGLFILTNPTISRIIITHLGYRPDTLTEIMNQDNLEIYLVPDYTQLEQVVIHGPLFQNTILNLPSSIAILQSKDIQKVDGTGYLETLNRLPGIYVHTGTINTNRVIVRGIGSRTPYGTNRIKAYFNDIPLTSGDGTTSLEDIDPSMINTIEIIKGSKSAIYGPGMGGIILLAGKEYMQEGLHGHAGVEIGSFGTMIPRIGLQYKKDQVSSSAAYTFSKSDGWRQNSSYGKHSGNIYSSLKTRRNKTDLFIHFIRMKAYIPSSLDEETFQNSPESAAASWLAVRGSEEYTRVLSGLRNNLKITDKLINTTILYFNYYRGHESRPFNILDDNSLQGGLKSMLNYQTGLWYFSAGFELMTEEYQWKIFETMEGNQGSMQNSYIENRNPISIFLHGAYTLLNSGIIEAGLSVNFMKYTIEDLLPDSLNHSGSYRYQPIISPFIGINLPLNDHIRLYGSAGHGFSYPGVEETLLPEGQANTDLKPERGINLEVGTRITAFKNRFYADANIYLLLVDDLLVTDRISEDIFFAKNAGKSRHLGFEGLTSLRVNEKASFHLPQTRLDLSITLSDHRFTDFTENGISYSGNYLPGIPASNFYTGVSFSYPLGIFLFIQYQYHGKQYLDDANTGNYEDWDVVHLKLGYTIRLRSAFTEIYFGIRNLFNRHYASMILINAPSFGGSSPRYYYPGQPRSFYVGLSVDL